jgi:hypothetical protein
MSPTAMMETIAIEIASLNESGPMARRDIQMKELLAKRYRSISTSFMEDAEFRDDCDARIYLMQAKHFAELADIEEQGIAICTRFIARLPERRAKWFSLYERVANIAM